MKQQFLGCHLWLQIQTWHMCCHLFADETAVFEVSSLITDFDVTYALSSFYRWDSSFWGVIFNYRFWRVMCVVIFLQMRPQKNSAPPWGGVKKLCPLKISAPQDVNSGTSLMSSLSKNSVIARTCDVSSLCTDEDVTRSLMNILYKVR